MTGIGGKRTLPSYDWLMFYRVILDCRPSAATASQPFITVKFVEAESENEATKVATERTKALMREKGFDDSAIAAFEFTTDEIAQFDRDKAAFDTEQALIYYSDG